MCWELLTKYTPDKYQKFGHKCSLYAINAASNIEGLKAKSISYKLLNVPRMLVLFVPTELKLEEIVPQSIKTITPEVLIYLLLQYNISQTEEVVNELKILINKVHSESFSAETLTNR